MNGLNPLFKVFGYGLMISFLGCLPLSTLNLTAMQISLQETALHAIEFSLGALLVEMIYVRISLVGINWVRKQEKLFRLMEWIAIAIVLFLAVGSFIAANSMKPQKNIVLENNLHRFLLGMSMSAINPMQIPFWFGWSAVLFNKQILKTEPSYFNIYIFGIGAGTFLGNAVFIFGGKWIAEAIGSSQQSMNYFLGIVFFITAVVMIFRAFKKKKRFLATDEGA